jgi:hypothetical protein
MKTASIMVLAGLFLAGSAASADTTAVYTAQSKAVPFTMTIEIADNGNIRYQMSTGRTYGLVLSGIDYFVDLSPKGPVVDRADDLVTAQKEAIAPFMSAFAKGATPSPKLVRIGEVTINGRTGQAFGYKSEGKGAVDAPLYLFNGDPELANVGKTRTLNLTDSQAKKLLGATVVVISHDPDLAQLGKAMAKQFGTTLTMFSGITGNTPGTFVQMEGLLQGGAPLSFGGMELQSVNHASIDAKRFELPAQPETLDQIRERMKPLAPPPTASPPKP